MFYENTTFPSTFPNLRQFPHCIYVYYAARRFFARYRNPETLPELIWRADLKQFPVDISKHNCITDEIQLQLKRFCHQPRNWFLFKNTRLALLKANMYRSTLHGLFDFLRQSFATAKGAQETLLKTTSFSPRLEHKNACVHPEWGRLQFCTPGVPLIAWIL